MVSTTDGVAWLEALAVRYEEVARLLRRTAACVAEMEATLAVGGVDGTDKLMESTQDVGEVSISEAVRQIMAAQNRPMQRREIFSALQGGRIRFRSRSKNIDGLLSSTLSFMRESKRAKHTDAGWVLL